MQKLQNLPIQEENDIKRIIDLFTRNYKTFGVCVLVTLFIAFIINRNSIAVYKVSSSLLIKEDAKPAANANMNDFLNSSLFKADQNFQNELWVLKSSPVISMMIQNLDLPVTYYSKDGLKYIDSYDKVPFRVYLLKDHVQPMDVRFSINIMDELNFNLKAKEKNVHIQKLDNNEEAIVIDKWKFEETGEFGKLIETPEMAFIVQLDTSYSLNKAKGSTYYFGFSSLPSLAEDFKSMIQFNIVQKDATVVEISMKSSSVRKSKDILNELMSVYSQQNLDRKNHIANITIDYIERQLGEISDSLAQTEDNLQNFRSSRQLLDITDQSTGITAQYRSLQNQMAEMVTRKRYYDYVYDYLSSNNDFADMIVPASMGIQDQLLNTLMADLIQAQAQRSNLIQNNQEKNPLVQKLTIQINNLQKTITENITAVKQTTDISIDEMNKRIRRIESEMSQMPETQRQLVGIERKFKLNDAIFNYLLEKRAEAKITKASNLPDVYIIEPAKMIGSAPVSPNSLLNYLIALFAGIALPFGFILIKGAVNNKIETQDEIERLSEVPVLGKILHNNKKTTNVVHEYPKATISESIRALRTNIEYQFKGIPRKVIFVTSSIEGEGKSFTALNLAMSYAHLNKKTILVDFDLRKPAGYFSKSEGAHSGLSSYYIDRANLGDIIMKSPHELLDFIPSGPIPPNPMELLTLDKTKELMNYLKECYDCIILDTTPLAQVSDAFLLMEYADIKVIVARFNYSLKKVFSFVMRDLKYKRVDNVCVVLNDNKYYSDQYGYGYGYEKSKA
jgi:tyrosine-protein kinase Etk/Wzc